MITFEVDDSVLRQSFVAFREDQLPFAMSKALNATAIDVQAAERAHLRDIFTLRRPDWADRSIKITHFAKKAEPWAEIAIAPPGQKGASRADILGKFEDQTEKASRTPGGHIVIPVDARRNKNDVITGQNRPRNLGLREVSSVRTHQTRIIGNRGTFLVRRADGLELILQRVRGETKPRVLYMLLQRPVPIVPDLHFHAIARQVVSDRWGFNLSAAMVSAMRTAR